MSTISPTFYEVLDEIEDYLDNLSDVDLDGGVMTANRELRLLQDLQAARKAWERARS